MPVQRRTDIDWLRGLAIVVMIEAHVFDAWTNPGVRASQLFGYAMILAGFAAPAFLFLAGVSTVLATSAGRGRASEGGAAAAVRRRGWQIFGLAFLFRAQAFSLDPGTYVSRLLDVDILNIMGPAIVLSGVVLGVRERAQRLALFVAIAATFTFLSPVVHVAPWLSWLPDALERYLRPRPGQSGFALFPWAAFLFAGGVVGMLIDRARTAAADRAFHLALTAAGGVVAVAAYAASYVPSMYGHSEFWTTSPAFFFLRIGILVMAVGLARLWSLRPRFTVVGRFGAMERFGRSSLFVYWIHVDLVYGRLALGLRNALSLSQVTVAFLLVTAVMFGLVVLKDWGFGLRRARRQAEAAAPVSV